MFTKFRLLLFLISLLGFSLSSCQKEALYSPGGPEAIENSESNAESDTISNLPEVSFDEIVDPDEEDKDEKEDNKD